jgi:hypothetical protein
VSHVRAEKGVADTLKAQIRGLGTAPTDAAKIKGWATPCASDHYPQSPLPEHTAMALGAPSPRMARDLGMDPPGSSNAGTEPGASRLNPRFSLWLMGYPTEWARCAEAVTRYARK